MHVHKPYARTHALAECLRSLYERKFNPSEPLGPSCLCLVLSRLSYFAPPAAATRGLASPECILPRGVCSALALPSSRCQRARGMPPLSRFHSYPLALDSLFIQHPLSPLPVISGPTEALSYVVQRLSALPPLLCSRRAALFAWAEGSNPWCCCGRDGDLSVQAYKMTLTTPR